MFAEFHFMRPGWFGLGIPLCYLFYHLVRQTHSVVAWEQVCDQHLLPYLIEKKKFDRRLWPLVCLFLSLWLMVVSLAGPTWSRLPVPSYQRQAARVVLLDMSEDMLVSDLTPDRLSRAKFMLHDLLQVPDLGQLGLVVYTSEPFVVSPLTQDANTIDALLSALTPDIMPVNGQHLARAMGEAEKLIRQAGAQVGDLLILTASAPSQAAVARAYALAHQGIRVSILPIQAEKTIAPTFSELAQAGKGVLLSYTGRVSDVMPWVSLVDMDQRFIKTRQQDIPLWKDQGRWLLLPAILFFLPVFRRGWLQKVYL